MSSTLHEIDWQRGSERARLLVASDQWVVDRLLTMLPDARLKPTSDGGINALVAERGLLRLVSDDQIREIDTVDLIDPEDQERWRVSSLKAGRPRARIRVLPSFSPIGAAEHAMMLILALTRKLLPDYSAAVDGSWSRPSREPTLFRQTLGIIGLGRSGIALAERATNFGMRVLFHDVVAKDEVLARLPIEARRFDQILREADIISLHLPANDDTVRLIDAPELAAMKSTSVLINIADGRLVDEGSLIKALRNGGIAGAGLDAFAYEPLSPDSPLIGFENVVLTPRTAWMSDSDVRAHWLREIVLNLSVED